MAAEEAAKKGASAKNENGEEEQGEVTDKKSEDDAAGRGGGRGGRGDDGTMPGNVSLVPPAVLRDYEVRVAAERAAYRMQAKSEFRRELDPNDNKATPSERKEREKIQMIINKPSREDKGQMASEVDDPFFGHDKLLSSLPRKVWGS